MEKYLITNKTIALLKKDNKTIIFSVDKNEVFNTNIKKIIEYSCNYYGSSIKGRKKSAKSILNIKYKLPIIIDENNNLILIQLNSPRENECLFLMTNKIIDYKKEGKDLKIICLNNRIFYRNISINSFEKLIVSSIRLNNVLNWRKSVNFL